MKGERGGKKGNAGPTKILPGVIETESDEGKKNQRAMGGVNSQAENPERPPQHHSPQKKGKGGIKGGKKQRTEKQSGSTTNFKKKGRGRIGKSQNFKKVRRKQGGKKETSTSDLKESGQD